MIIFCCFVHQINVNNTNEKKCLLCFIVILQSTFFLCCISSSWSRTKYICTYRKGSITNIRFTLFGSQLGAKFAQFQLEWILLFFFAFCCWILFCGFYSAHSKKSEKGNIKRDCTIEMNFWACSLWNEKVWSTNKKNKKGGKGQKSGNLLMFGACLGFEWMKWVWFMKAL